MGGIGNGGFLEAVVEAFPLRDLQRFTKALIVGQIHGNGDIKSVPWVMLHYFDGAIKVVVKQKQSGDAAMTYALADDVPLSTPFTYRISDDGNGSLTFALDADGHTTTATAPVPEAFSGADVRFQVGAYQQAQDPKELHWIEGATHVDLYDKDEYVTPAVDKLTDFYTANLAAAADKLAFAVVAESTEEAE